MELFSHNTMTYRSPKLWWLKPLFWMARCQKNNYITLYKNGARYFDLRISFNQKGDIEFSHFIFRYDAKDFWEVIEWMRHYAKLVRITLENNHGHTKLFIQLCQELESLGIILCGGYDRSNNWKIIYPCNKEPELINCYASLTNWSKIDDIFPWLYSIFNNKKLLKLYKNTNKILFIDFI